MSGLLFTPFSLGKLELANRIIVPPMCQYSSEDGLAAEWHSMHYGTLAASGAGMVIVEATAVTPEGRISPHDLGIWSAEAESALKRMLDGIRAYSNTPIALQLAHAGRKASQHRPWDAEAGKAVPAVDRVEADTSTRNSLPMSNRSRGSGCPHSWAWARKSFHA